MNTNNCTGPRTPAGKDIASRNSTKHGLCATETVVLLPTESMDALKALEAAWFRSYEPRDKAEEHLIHQLVTADWFLQRALRTYAEIESQLFAQTPNPLDWTDLQHKAIARFLRYKTTHTNNVAKHRRAIEEYRRGRNIEQRQQETLTIAQERLKVHQQKNKPEPTWDETILEMRKKAKALGFSLPDDAPHIITDRKDGN